MERIGADDKRIAHWAVVTGGVDIVNHHTSEQQAATAQELLAKERQTLLDTARTDGYEQGLQRANQEIKARVSAAEMEVRETNAAEAERLRLAREQLTLLLQELPGAVAMAESRMEATAIEIAFLGITRLLGAQMTDRTLLPALCGQALAEYKQRPITLKVAPVEVDCLLDLNENDAIRVVSDSRLLPGQCHLETHKGVFDTGIDVRLEALKQAFLRGLAEEKV
jgi:flagellar assembly protein FliH